MKYLRKFNEAAVSQFFYNDYKFGLELQEFCNDYLAYLIDKGFSVTLRDGTLPRGAKSKIIVISKERTHFLSPSNFTWEEVVDDFIPFYTMLKSKYELLPFVDGKRILTDKTILISDYSVNDRGADHLISDDDIVNLTDLPYTIVYIRLLVKHKNI